MWTIILVIEVLFWLSLTLIPEVWIGLAIFYFFFLVFSWVNIVKPNRVRTKEVLGKYTWILRQWFSLVIPFVTKTIDQDLYRKNFIFSRKASLCKGIF